jgi:hypothetical protein
MTTQMPPIEPLDEHERELARIVRALPGGEPPAALDAAILRAAANAAAASRRPGARWLASAGALWGIGGAAAAVLALGVSWQMMYPAPPSSLAEPASAPAMSEEADDAPVSIEFKDQVPRDFDNSGPPPPPPLAKPAPSRRAQPAMNAPASAPPSEPLPQAFAADSLDEHVASEADADSGVAAMAAPAPAAPPAPVVADREAYSAKSAAQERSNVEGARKSATTATLESRTRSESAQAQLGRADARDQLGAAAESAADANATATGGLAAPSKQKLLTASEWLDQIRKLRDANRREEAKASLVEFRRRYPHVAIPEDLKPLRE